MGRDQRSNKELKKKAVLTPKEKRAAKKAKKDAVHATKSTSRHSREYDPEA